MEEPIKTVNIRPGVSVLSVLRHLNYKAWFALAEFVDNSIQSFLDNEDTLKALHGDDFKLKISIDIEAASPGRIKIVDNAAGIASAQYKRAFRPAEIPPDRSGLSEFGIGMKSAACWFSPHWRVRTKAIGEAIERKIRFDIARIVQDDISELEIEEAPVDKNSHYTEIILDDLHQVPIKRSIGKIKEHLADIYRVFLRRGDIEIYFNTEPLSYENPRILFAEYFSSPGVPEPQSTEREWRKEIDFDFGSNLRVTGFAALRETASTSRAGFGLFRRNRLIQGSADEGYRPQVIFGAPNSYAFQRLFGELHLEGFDVSHTKDGFRWDENEDPFLGLLKEILDSDELPLLRQADNYRTKVTKEQKAAAAKKALDNTVKTIEPIIAAGLESAAKAPTDVPEPPKYLPEIERLASRTFNIIHQEEPWEVTIDLTYDPVESDWLKVSDFKPSTSSSPRQLHLRLSLAHPFSDRFASADPQSIEVLLRMAAAIGLSETLGRNAGVKYSGAFRRTINELLLNVFSKQ